MCSKKNYGIQLMNCSKNCHSLLELFFLQLFTGVLEQNNLSQKYSVQKIYAKKVMSEFAICHQKFSEIAFKKSLCLLNSVL